MSSEIEAVRVLLVDDEVDFVEPLGERLEFRGFGVTTATSGDEALEKLATIQDAVDYLEGLDVSDD